MLYQNATKLNSFQFFYYSNLERYNSGENSFDIFCDFC